VRFSAAMLVWPYGRTRLMARPKAGLGLPRRHARRLWPLGCVFAYRAEAPAVPR
jgi:hypothetical protein